jgi:hypothetical protein
METRAFVWNSHPFLSNSHFSSLLVLFTDRVSSHFFSGVGRHLLLGSDLVGGPKIPPLHKRQQHPEKDSLMSSENAVMWRDDTVPMAKVDLVNNLFPHAVVWGPLGPLTCCCPCVGHMGIADSQGRIHDFAGPYRIGVDDFMVGCVLRYYTVPIQKGGEKEWDEAVEKADAIYRKKVHDICCENCHHHTALALEASGRPQWGYRGLLSSWLLCALYGRCTLWHCLYCD